MFECDAEGCFDSALYTMTTTDMQKSDVCESCLEYLESLGHVIFASRNLTIA
jgi:hypothetical protein